MLPNRRLWILVVNLECGSEGFSLCGSANRGIVHLSSL